MMLYGHIVILSNENMLAGDAKGLVWCEKKVVRGK